MFCADGTEIEVYRTAIEALPLQEEPELFGLHSNADLTFRTLQVADAMAVMAVTQPKDGGGSAGGFENAAAAGPTVEVKVNKTCESLLAKMPPIFKGQSVSYDIFHSFCV